MAFNSFHLTVYLAYLSGIPSGMSSDILSGISSDILSGRSSDILSGLSGISSDILSDIISGHTLWHSIWLCLWPLRSGWSPARPTALRLSPVEVRRGPQRSDSRRLKSGEAHSDRALAVGVRQGPLPSSAGRRGPATTTAIKRWQMMSGDDHCDQGLADEVRPGPLQSRAGRWGPARKRRRGGEGGRGELDQGAAHLT